MKELDTDGFMGKIYQTPKDEVNPFLCNAFWKNETEEPLLNSFYRPYHLNTKRIYDAMRKENCTYPL